MAIAAAVTGLLAVTGCTSSTSAPPPGPSTRTVIETRSPTPSRTFTPAPATSVHPLLPNRKPGKGERDGSCPYVRPGLDEGPDKNPNIANLEGDRVYRTTRLTELHPIGCRFYFAYSFGNTRHEAVADIVPTTFATATEAHNAMVRTAQAGKNLQSAPQFVAGVDGIRYQTRFFGPDGDSDWAFVFAKGEVMVVVHTQQTDSSLNALLIAKAIVMKF